MSYTLENCRLYIRILKDGEEIEYIPDYLLADYYYHLYIENLELKEELLKEQQNNSARKMSEQEKE